MLVLEQVFDTGHPLRQKYPIMDSVSRPLLLLQRLMVLVNGANQRPNYNY